ncbi:hypothetical protein LAA31_002443 [Salmonella enterica subsp. enterica serovar Enteritidis]|nr:hypothetical protein [Salmonella enterica subsp. enterica serovar Enteritidis]
MNFTRLDYTNELVDKEKYKFTVDLGYGLLDVEKDVLHKEFREQFGALFCAGFRRNTIDIGYSATAYTDEEMFKLVTQIIGTRGANRLNYSNELVSKEHYKFTVRLPVPLTEEDKNILYKALQTEFGKTLKVGFRSRSIDIGISVEVCSDDDLYELVSEVIEKHL